jgi:prevent-host-death family protein
MIQVNVQDAKTRLSELLAQVEHGEQVVIARAGSPVARLVPFGSPAPRQFGGLTLQIADDFDAPLSDEELGAWE